MLHKLIGRPFRKKPPVLVGVDIGCNFVKLLELSENGSRCSRQYGHRYGYRYKVENYASVSLPEQSAVTNTGAKTAQKNAVLVEEVGAAIAKAVNITHTRGSHAVVAVAGSAVLTRTIEMSASLDDTGMEQQIIVEADQYIPYPLDEVVIDFERTGKATKNPGMVEVSLAACKRESVEQRVAALEIGGLSARAVEVESHTMERAYHLLREQMNLEKRGVVAIFDIGSSMITLYILVNGEVTYTREQLLDGTRSLEEITEQISDCLQFFFSSSQYNAVDLVVLAGDLAAIKSLEDAVGKRLSTPAVVANPFAGMEVGSRVSRAHLLQDAASLMLACGLAMRGMKGFD